MTLYRDRPCVFVDGTDLTPAHRAFVRIHHEALGHGYPAPVLTVLWELAEVSRPFHAEYRSTEADTAPDTMVADAITSDTAATLLGISPRAVRARAARGSLPGWREPDGSWRFSLAAVEELRDNK